MVSRKRTSHRPLRVDYDIASSTRPSMLTRSPTYVRWDAHTPLPEYIFGRVASRNALRVSGFVRPDGSRLYRGEIQAHLYTAQLYDPTDTSFVTSVTISIPIRSWREALSYQEKHCPSLGAAIVH